MRTFVISAWLSTVLCCSLPVTADDDAPAPNLKAATDRDSIVTLGSPRQQLAGIRTQKLEAVTRQPEFLAYGTVLNLDPLLQLRQQYLAARSQQDAAQARYTEANQNLARTQNLHDQAIVSTRRLQEQQARRQSDKAGLDAASFQQQTLLAASRLEWGDALTEWFVQTPGPAAKAFLSQAAQLIQITLPPDRHLSSDVHSIAIDEHGHRDTVTQATLISASPRIDPVSQGERYFFKLENRHLPFGAHISAWIAANGQPQTGVIVPKSALVWHLGQALVFVKTAEQNFKHLVLSAYHPDPGGYFVTELQAGDEIVVTGAQTLLSEELKGQIPREDDD